MSIVVIAKEWYLLAKNLLMFQTYENGSICKCRVYGRKISKKHATASHELHEQSFSMTTHMTKNAQIKHATVYSALNLNCFCGINFKCDYW